MISLKRPKLTSRSVVGSVVQVEGGGFSEKVPAPRLRLRLRRTPCFFKDPGKDLSYLRPFFCETRGTRLAKYPTKKNYRSSLARADRPQLCVKMNAFQGFIHGSTYNNTCSPNTIHSGVFLTGDLFYPPPPPRNNNHKTRRLRIVPGKTCYGLTLASSRGRSASNLLARTPSFQRTPPAHWDPARAKQA